MLRRWCWVFWLLLLIGCQASEARLGVKPGLMLDQDPAAFTFDGQEARARTENYFFQGDATGEAAVARDEKQAEPRHGPSEPAVQERMLIQRGQVQVEVGRPEDSAREFLVKVQAAGGYLQQQVGTTLTVRLPATAFDTTFAAVKAMGRVLAEQRQADDVTEEFVDLGIRLDNARKARDRLLEILQKADKVEDILKVEAELRRLTEEIERMEGRKKFLADQVAMATLRATFSAPEAGPSTFRARVRSPFWWIEEAGPEALLEAR